MGRFYEAAEVVPGNKWEGYPTLNYDKLVEFALHMYRRLQDLEEVGFQSLDVGGRLDIGVSPSGDEFFVNELTRWYGAHQFALTTQASSQPGDKMCRAFARAFAETRDLEPREDILEDAVLTPSKKRGRPRKIVEDVSMPTGNLRKRRRINQSCKYIRN